MKSLKTVMGRREDREVNAYGKRFRKDDGKDILLPGHITDFVEQGVDKRKVFDHTIYARKNYNNTRNTRVKKNFDVVSRVVNKRDSWKQQTEDRT